MAAGIKLHVCPCNCVEENEMLKLENQYLRNSKMALIRATSVEIDRLRQCIISLASALHHRGFTPQHIQQISVLPPDYALSANTATDDFKSDMELDRDLHGDLHRDIDSDHNTKTIKTMKTIKREPVHEMNGINPMQNAISISSDDDEKEMNLRTFEDHIPLETLESTKQRIASHFSRNRRRSVCLEKLIISLIDSYSQCRITVPVRGTQCQHLQPFDLKGFLMRPRKYRKCTHCNQQIEREDLVKILYFDNIVQEVTSRYGDAVEKVELLWNGSWKPIVNDYDDYMMGSDFDEDARELMGSDIGGSDDEFLEIPLQTKN